MYDYVLSCQSVSLYCRSVCVRCIAMCMYPYLSQNGLCLSRMQPRAQRCCYTLYWCRNRSPMHSDCCVIKHTIDSKVILRATHIYTAAVEDCVLRASVCTHCIISSIHVLCSCTYACLHGACSVHPYFSSPFLQKAHYPLLRIR